MRKIQLKQEQVSKYQNEMQAQSGNGLLGFVLSCQLGLGTESSLKTEVLQNNFKKC